MSGRMSKSKGYRGEIEVKTILEGIVEEVYGRMKIPAPELARSPNGRDILGLNWLAIEVKRHERDNPYVISEWWTQTKEQAGNNRVPVLFYRMNNRPWNVKMFGFLELPKGRIRCPVEIGLEAFLAWFRNQLEGRLG